MAGDPLGPLPLTVRSVPMWTKRSVRKSEIVYTAIICSIGYEERSSHVVRTLRGSAAQIIGFAFDRQHVLSYADNLKFISSIGKVVSEPEHAYRKVLANEIRELGAAWSQAEKIHVTGSGTRPLRLAVDYSSMSRQRIADTIMAIYADSGVPVDVDWLYSPATYPGSAAQQGPIRVNEPVYGFEGWGDPERSLICIFGAGFEGDLALGVLDDLEPQDTWALRPKGYSSRHDAELSTLNQRVFHSLPADRVLDYRVDQPYETLLRLESLVDELVTHNRVVLLPLGPKIFALLSFLVGLSDRRNVTVWRVSADVEREPIQRRASGDIVAIRVASWRLSS